MAPAQVVTLTCHPDFRSDAVRAIEVAVQRTPHGTLALTYGLSGALARILIPPRCAPRIVLDLWQHTCLEVFVAVDGARAYHELNFAPSGEWAAFAFRDYRDGEPLENDLLAPSIDVRHAPARFELDAHVPLHRLSEAYINSRLRLGLSAVVETRDGALSYWAVHHPREYPDFHHAEARAVWLEPAAAE